MSRPSRWPGFPPPDFSWDLLVSLFFTLQFPPFFLFEGQIHVDSKYARRAVLSDIVKKDPA